MRYLPLILMLVVARAGFAADAKDVPPVRLDKGYTDSFLNYLPYRKPAEPPKVEPPHPPAPQAAEKPKPGKEKVTVKWLREHFDELRDYAIDHPDDRSAMEAYLYVQRIILDKSQRFAEARQAVVNTDPLLNENNRVPTASMGATSVSSANYLAEEQAVRELAAIGGVLIFVDGKCRFCEKQIPIMNGLKHRFGLEYLVVSIDGTIPANYAGAVQKDNGLFGRLGLKLTPSVVFVANPKGYSGNDPNTYLIVSQGFYTQQSMAKQIAFAGHNQKLLSENTMRDLDVWDRGVASGGDLDTLELDISRPGTFKETLQPLLLKQYEKK